MRNDKHIAIKPKKQEKSYGKISKETGVPKSTTSDWLSGINWSQDIKNDLTRKTNYIARKRLGLINVSSRELKEKIFVWIEFFHKKFSLC